MVKEYTSITEAIKDIYGTNSVIIEKKEIFGGDINRAYRLTLADGKILFMKSNRARALDNLRAEAAGLDAIRETRAIGVPTVLGLGKDGNDAFLLLEFLPAGRQVKDFWELFARELANMHMTGTPENGMFGFAIDNYIGSNEQKNDWHGSWISFFRDCRLKPQVNMASSYFSSGQRKEMDSLLDKLDRYLVEPEKPSLIHGDLWSGNMITGSDGKGWLIDPAVYYGHPEADIAMTELFGGFSYRFYGAYREAANSMYGYEDRKDLYNLYHLLNHLNLFGGGYLSSVLRIVKRYV